jgi:osmotically-inducible protein OsmY
VATNFPVEVSLRSPSADNEIAAAAIECLAGDPWVARATIAVTVEQGRVALSGQVRRYYQKAAAAQDVARLPGVVEVANHITVEPVLDL